LYSRTRHSQPSPDSAGRPLSHCGQANGRFARATAWRLAPAERHAAPAPAAAARVATSLHGKATRPACQRDRMSVARPGASRGAPRAA
jgi:hypothetical protein